MILLFYVWKKKDMLTFCIFDKFLFGIFGNKDSWLLKKSIYLKYNIVIWPFFANEVKKIRFDCYIWDTNSIFSGNQIKH